MAGGQSFTGGQGSVGRAITIALVGIAIAAAQGTTTANTDGTVALVGQEIAASGNGSAVLQNVWASYERSPTGQEITSTAGTLTLVSTPTGITGQAVTSAAGIATAAGQDLTVNISGSEFDAVQGSVNIGPTQISGQVSTSAAGTAPPNSTIALTGVAATFAQGLVAAGLEADDTFIQSSHGNVVQSHDVALAGSELVAAAGTVAPTGDIALPLTGEATTSAAGSLGFGYEFPLTGEAITSARGAFGAPGTGVLSGQEVAVQAGDVFLDDDRSYALTGAAITSAAGNAVTSYLAFVIGQELDIQQQGLGPRAVELTGEQINSAAGEVEPPRDKKKVKPPKKKHRELVVEIDGEDFFVGSEEEAAELLQQARETYKEQVQEVTSQLLRKAQDPTVVVQPVRMPRIRAVGPEGPQLDALIKEVATLRQDIKALHDQTAALQKKIVNDDEEALALLL